MFKSAFVISSKLLQWSLACFLFYVSAAFGNNMPIKTHTPEIRLIANHLPPYMIVTKTESGTSYDGFEHELTQKLTTTLGVNFTYFECSWPQCMRALRNGDVDMAHTLLYSKARASFLEFIEPAYLKGTHVTVFYQRYDDKRIIDDFSDLQQDQFVIGYLGSTVYFDEFESARNLLKMDVKTQEIGLSLLASGRIDVLAGFDELFEGIEFRSPNIKRVMKKSVYQPTATLQSHTVISKASALYAYRDDITRAIQQLAENGELEQLGKKWVSNIH